MRKMFLLLFCLVLLVSHSVVWASGNVDDVRTICKTEKKVSVEYPFVITGSKSVNEKINSEIGRTVDALVGEANTLGGGKVHYDLHRVDPGLISMSIIMTPQQGVEETMGLTFDRTSGEKRPLSYYYDKDELLKRAADGLKFLYDIDPAKGAVAPDTYYVDEDNNVIGIYHAGAVMDKSEGEIETDLTAAVTVAAEPVVTTEPAKQAPVYTGAGNKGTITGTEVRIRAGAGTDFAILGYFAKGEVVQVIKSDVVKGTKWYNVTRADGTSGWVAGDYCGLDNKTKAAVEAAAPVEKKGKIVGTDVRMRSEPNLNADVLDYFMNGEIVTILDAATGSDLTWTKVKRANGDVGWVSSAYCQEQ